MKKYIYVLVVLLMLPLAVYAQDYSDEEVKVKYEVNSDIWTKTSLSAERETIKHKWKNDDCGVLMYGTADVWSELTPSEKSGYSRSDFNHTILTDDYLYTYEEMLNDTGYSINQSNFIDYGMKMMKFSGNATYNGYHFDYLTYITINNGYMIQWQYYGETDTICLSRVTNAISSTTPTNLNSSYSPDFNIPGILISLVLTVVCYMAYPFIQTKFLNKKYTKETCNKMAIWNSVIVGFVFMIITISIDQNATWSAGPAFLYYWINRTLWISKTSSTIKQEARPDVTICTCGCKVLKEFDKCPKCGKKM